MGLTNQSWLFSLIFILGVKKHIVLQYDQTITRQVAERTMHYINDSIRKVLRIAEKNLTIIEASYETLQKKKTLITDAILLLTPCACRSCGSTVVDENGKTIIVEDGKKEMIVCSEQYNHMPLVMRLEK